jgi:hypothetical protein
MNIIKTYERHECIPDSWFSLHKRKDYPVWWVLTIKMPWKARIYTIHNDAWQLRHPRISFMWRVFREPFWHQCTKAELERQNRDYGL